MADNSNALGQSGPIQLDKSIALENSKEQDSPPPSQLHTQQDGQNPNPRIQLA